MAAALLDRVQTGQRTQDAQQSAVTRLTAMIAALDREAQERSAAGTPPKPPAGKTPASVNPTQAGPAKQPSPKPDVDPGAGPGKPGTEPGSVRGPGGPGEGPATGPAALRAEIERLWGSLPPGSGASVAVARDRGVPAQVRIAAGGVLQTPCRTTRPKPLKKRESPRRHGEHGEINHEDTTTRRRRGQVVDGMW